MVEQFALKCAMEIQKIQLVVQDLLHGARIFSRVSNYFRIMLLHISWMLLLNVNYNLHNLKQKQGTTFLSLSHFNSWSEKRMSTEVSAENINFNICGTKDTENDI